MINEIYRMESKRIVSGFCCCIFYEGSRAEFLRVGILDEEQNVPKKRGGTVNVGNGNDGSRIRKITMTSSGKLRVWADRDLAAEWPFRDFLRKILLPLPPEQLKDFGGAHV